ncbi:MAG: circularly permuted type 2 ATP-grasp protein, partial [Deinococcus sp.]
AVYAYVPAMIEYYLGEKPLLPNVPTLLGWDPEGLAEMLSHPQDLVIKAVGEAGGYGMLVGPASTPEQIRAFVRQVEENPRNYVAQPTIALSRHPTFYPDSGRFEPAHVDLRPYILVGEGVTIIPGGLTRVALTRGSLVVNSSQGGGSKDTWVLADGETGLPEGTDEEAGAADAAAGQPSQAQAQRHGGNR